MVASHVPPGDLAHNPGMCPDWELNQRPFGLQAGTQPTEPHQPGQGCIFLDRVSEVLLEKDLFSQEAPNYLDTRSGRLGAWSWVLCVCVGVCWETGRINRIMGSREGESGE